MKCTEIKELLSAYADGELSPQQRDMVEKHLAECSECRNKLVEYERIQGHLTSLQRLPSILNFTQDTMSKIRKLCDKKNSYTVKRRLLVAVPFVIILAVLASLYPTMLTLKPGEVIAKAYAATEAVESFKTNFSYAVKTTGMTTWLDTCFYEIEYVSEDQYHYKTGTYYPKTEMELIVFSDKIYSRESPSLSPMRSALLENEIENCINGNNFSYLVSKEYTLAFLDSLISVNEVSQERIDGVICRHYRAQRDVEKIIAELKESMSRNYGLDPSDPKLNWVDDLIQKTQHDVEVWIGKDDYLVRQIVYTRQPVVQGSNLVSNAVTKLTTKCFDFNVPIIIQPPLTSSGDLLPDWMVTNRK